MQTVEWLLSRTRAGVRLQAEQRKHSFRGLLYHNGFHTNHISLRNTAKRPDPTCSHHKKIRMLGSDYANYLGLAGLLHTYIHTHIEYIHTHTYIKHHIADHAYNFY